MSSHVTVHIIENYPQEADKFRVFAEQNGVEVHITSAYKFEPLIPLNGFAGVIVSGGTPGVYEMDQPENAFMQEQVDYILEAIDRDVPVLGVCLGHQLLAHALGGTVTPARNPEYGWHPVTLLEEAANDPLFRGLEGRFVVFQYHNDEVIELPQGATRLAWSEAVPVQAFRYKDKLAWGIQCHPEWPPDEVAGMLERRREELEAKGIDVDAMIAKGYEAFGPPNERIYANFFDIVKSRGS